MILSKDAEDPLRQLIIKRSAEPNFGNGRGVRNLLEDILEENNSRLAKILHSGKEPDFETIEAEEIEAVLEKGTRRILRVSHKKSPNTHRAGMGAAGPRKKARAAASAGTRAFDPAPCEAYPPGCKVSSYSR